MPASYDQNKDRRYPVMYWLHGIGGAQTGLPRIVERLNTAIEAGKTPEMLVVFANGVRNSFYCDSIDGKRPVETVIVKDLIPHIDQTYRTVATRSGRLIEGFSMGGFGAAHLGFKYPDVFGAVSMIDSALVTADVMATHHAELFQRMFGSKKEHFEPEDPRVLVEKNVQAIRGRTPVRIIVGALGPGNQSYHTLLIHLEIPHEYEVFAGAGHNHGVLYDKLGEKNWAFYRAALGPERGQ